MKEIRVTELKKEQRCAMRRSSFFFILLVFITNCLIIREVVHILYPGNSISSSIGVTKTEEQYPGVDLQISLDEQFQSTVYYFEVYENGNLTERQILNVSSKNVQQQEIVFIPIENDIGAYETIKMISANDKEGYGEKNYSLSEPQEGAFCQNILESGRMKIKPQQDLILNIAYFEKEEATEKIPLSCKKLNKMSREEQQESLRQQDFVIVLRGVYSDLPSEETRNH